MPKIVDKEEVQAQILQAAMHEFTHVGVHAATISGVAKAANMGKGTLYLYYDSKDAIIAALADQIFRQIEANLIADKDFKTLEAFGRHLRSTMSYSDEQGQGTRVFFEIFGPSFASESFVAKVADFFDRLGAYYAEKLEALQGLGEIRNDIDPKITGRSLAAMVDGVILHKGLFSIPTRRHSALVRAAIDLVISGLKPH
ncbi:MAG: TetR/AcrR family transcriptional regulator [Pseudomonadota bacterium]